MTNFYELGFAAGRNAAILCCLGGARTETPDFETAADEADYYDGYADGYNDIDD